MTRVHMHTLVRDSHSTAFVVQQSAVHAAQTFMLRACRCITIYYGCDVFCSGGCRCWYEIVGPVTNGSTTPGMSSAGRGLNQAAMQYIAVMLGPIMYWT